MVGTQSTGYPKRNYGGLVGATQKKINEIIWK